MSMSSSLFRQNTNDMSGDVDDLRQQNRYLYEQNVTLKKSLQELININTQLTQSIQEFNTSHVQNFPHINQQEIEQLALRVIELQQELEKQKNQRKNQQGVGNQFQNSNTVQETLKVIEELVNSFRSMQEEYQQQLQRMEGELENQKSQWVQMSQAIQQKLTHFQDQYSKLLAQTRHSEGVIKSMEHQLQQKSRNALVNRKQMKISTTIQDLRLTLERQIEEKDKIIRNYEHVIEGIKGKLSQKIGS